MGDEKTFRLRVTLRNNRIVSRREALGLSQKALAETINISWGTLLRYEGFKTTPVASDGGWKKSAKTLALFFNVLPEDLWPEEALLVQKSSVQFELSLRGVQALLGAGDGALALPPPEPEKALEEKQEAETLRALVEDLPERERRIVKERLGFDGGPELTLDQIATGLGVSRSRVQQQFERALGALRKGLTRGERTKEQRSEAVNAALVVEAAKQRRTSKQAAEIAEQRRFVLAKTKPPRVR